MEYFCWEESDRRKMKIFVSTGEVSGDLHLSYLAKVIQEKYPDCQLYGVAGEHSKKVGVQIIQDIQDLAVMGFWEAVKKYGYLKEKMEEYLAFIEKEKIEKVLVVDYGGFHLKFLKALKEKFPQVKVYYYIPPKIWVWGKSRIKTLKLADEIMVIFPWEVDFYARENVKVHYFGNPLAEKNLPRKTRGEKILLLPGSRKQEITSMLAMYFELIQKHPKKKFIMKLANEEAFYFFSEEWKKIPNVEFVIGGELSSLVETCSMAIAVSGTVTLELALLGLPSIVVYKTSSLNYFIAKYILKLGYISLPNLTLEEEVFPELIQGKCNLEEIERAMISLEQNQEKIDRKLKEIRHRLSGDNIVERYAHFLVKGEL